MLERGTARVLERQALTPFLQRQPWFAARSKVIREARFSDWAVMSTGSTPVFLTIVAVEDVEGATERYLLPLALLKGDAAVQVLRHAPGSVLARITGARKGVVVDGWQDDAVCEKLLGLVMQADETATARGSLRGVRIGAPAELPDERIWVRSAGDESNSVAFLDDRYVLKLFRRLEPGPNPEVELGRYFVEHGFSRTPALAGSMEYHRPGEAPATIGLVQAAVKHQGSGWDYSIGDLQRYFERVATRVRRSDRRRFVDGEDDAPSTFFLALEQWYLSTAATLGRRTAEMHLTLLEGTGPDFAPEQMTPADVGRLAGAMQARTEESLDLLQHRLGSLGDAVRPHAEAVLGVRDALMACFERVRIVDPAGLRIRIHGDYHLGQVLRTEEDFVIIDFEGEPERSLAERRTKQSPLKDVAGMIRSFGYAAYVALFGFMVHAPDGLDALEPWADTWQRWSADAFLTAYRSAITNAATDVVPIPQDDESCASMLSAFVLDKASSELTYELNNRPDWIRIPLAGMLKLASRLQS